MTTISLKEAKQNLEKLIAQVIADAEPIVLSTEAGEEVVLLSMDEFTSWKETSYLLTNPANAAHLRQSISESNSGQVHEKELMDV
ncbi:MAG TPA: type II toxin-antitoxin system prevent-host-death family antitoxin [Pyrinomonadaceae bacterium]|nr:type II toxin-antitoxin system prevent-host-death family antitoxin [Pyrinomonadaceae bacterium]